MQTEVQYVSDADGNPVGVLVPIELWREIASQSAPSCEFESPDAAKEVEETYPLIDESFREAWEAPGDRGRQHRQFRRNASRPAATPPPEFELPLRHHQSLPDHPVRRRSYRSSSPSRAESTDSLPRPPTNLHGRCAEHAEIHLDLATKSNRLIKDWSRGVVVTADTMPQ
jgi:hypothetical protein